MVKAGDLCFAVSAADVSNRNLESFKIEFRCTENEVEITERIEVTEIGAARL